MKISGEILGYKYIDILHYLTNIGINVIFAILILIVGFWLAKRIGKIIKNFMTLRNADAGLTTFISNFATIASKIIVVLTAISQLGIEMTSFVTVLGAAGIAVGMAFSGTLSNFAGGILILVIRPFKVGDTITALTLTGEVIEIQIFNTYIKTPDNKIIILPNGPLINGTIINLTKEGKRRIDFILPIKYGTDLKVFNDNIEKIISENPSVLKSPQTQIYFTEFDLKSGKMTVSCWVKTQNYGVVQRELSNEFFKWLEPIED